MERQTGKCRERERTYIPYTCSLFFFFFCFNTLILLRFSVISYEHFDFHKECAGMKYENISKLVAALREQFEQYGYSHFTLSDKELQRKQAGTFRVNCIDCLDRTNVVQVSSVESVRITSDVDLTPDLSRSP